MRRFLSRFGVITFDDMNRLKKGGLLVALMTLLIAFAVPAAIYAKGNGKAEMTVKDAVHNFGNIREDGGPVTYDFEFENTGDANLVILNATAECGCTKPEFPQQPIAPGKKGVISVTYAPIGRPGGFDKVVTVKTNGKPSKLRLKIRGTVIPKK